MSKHEDSVQRTSVRPFGICQSEGAEDVGLTIYQTGGLAVVRELRALQLSQGFNQVYLAGLPTAYQANSLVVLDYEGEGDLSLGPVSYRAANLDEARILQGSLGQKVTVREQSATGKPVYIKGTLRAVLGGKVAVERADNHRICMVPASQIELDQLPPGLSATPSLMMSPTASAEGAYNVGLMYEAGGLGWTARYFAFYDEKASKLTRLEASVAIANRSGARFDAALVQLLAGANYAQADAYAMAESAPMGGGGRMALAKRSVAPRRASVQTVGDVKVYKLPERVTIGDGETQQVTLFLAKDVPVVRQYFLAAGGYDNTPGEDAQKLPVFIRLRAENTEENNLGAALPDGEVAILQPDADGKPQKTFTASMEATTEGESFKLEFGPSADIKAERVLLSASETEEVAEEAGEDETGGDEGHLPIRPLAEATGGPGMPSDRVRDIVRGAVTKPVGEDETETDVETPRFREEERQLTVYNYKAEAVEVLVAEHIPQGAEFISKPEGHDFIEDNVLGAAVNVKVAAKGKTTLQYRLRWQLN